jgi:hypothetical protein
LLIGDIKEFMERAGQEKTKRKRTREEKEESEPEEELLEEDREEAQASGEEGMPILGEFFEIWLVV